MEWLSECEFQGKIHSVLANLHLGRHCEEHIAMHALACVDFQPFFIVLDEIAS